MIRLEVQPYCEDCPIFEADVEAPDKYYMGWHEPTKNITYNGVSFCSRCKYCHKRIHQDSQGNWF